MARGVYERDDRDLHPGAQHGSQSMAARRGGQQWQWSHARPGGHERASGQRVLSHSRGTAMSNNQESRNAGATRRAFTVLELLVVMAVIGILACLLLPVLSQSRETARRVQCLENLRQLGLAAQMYWDDNDGLTFRY